LRQVFPGLEEDDLVELASVAKLRAYPPDVVLCHEGRSEETFYVIVSGQTEVSKLLDGGTQEVLNRPGPGEFVGEISLVQEIPRTATVRTTEPTTVLEIDHSSFVDMLHRSAPMAVRIMLEITPRLRDIDLATIANLRQKNTELMQAYEKLQEQYKELEKQR